MVGVNSGDGRGNITAYATVFDSEAGAAARPRLLGLLARHRPADRVVRLRRLGDERRRPVHGLLDLLPDGRHRRRVPRLRRSGADLYNFGPLNHYQRPERRYSLGAMGHYEFGEHADVYTQLMFNDYESVAQIAPSRQLLRHRHDQLRQPVPAGEQPGDDRLRTRRKSRPATDVPMYIGRRNVEGGGRQQSFANNSFRAVAGVRGAINDGLGLRRLGAVLERVGQRRRRSTTSSINRAASARSTWSTSAACRPASRSSTAPTRTASPGIRSSRAASPRTSSTTCRPPASRSAASTRRSTTPSVNGDLGVYGIKSPLASDGIQVVFGTEWRRDTLEQHGRRAAEQGQLAGSGGADDRHQRRHQGRGAVHGSPHPDRAGPGVGMESLSFDTAYRYSDYGDGVQTDTYKFGLEWAPVAGRPPARQLPAGGPCGQHRRAVHGAGLQPVRRDGRSLRRGGPRSGSERRGVHRVGRAGGHTSARNVARQPGGPVQLPPGRQHRT